MQCEHRGKAPISGGEDIADFLEEVIFEWTNSAQHWLVSGRCNEPYVLNCCGTLLPQCYDSLNKGTECPRLGTCVKHASLG